MATQEERLAAVENDLKQFKTETVKSYREMAIEVTMMKGLTEDTVIRLRNLKVQIDQRFESVDQRFDAMDIRLDGMDRRFDGMDRRFDAMDRRLTTIETLLVQVLARLPEKP